MRNKRLNHNKAFMTGIMAMAVVVICVVIVFWMWCFPGKLVPADEPAADSIPSEWQWTDSCTQNALEADTLRD